MANFLKIAKLDEKSVTKIKELEKSLGTHIMAYQAGLKIANLSESQLQKIKDAENELDVILLAYAE